MTVVERGGGERVEESEGCAHGVLDKGNYHHKEAEYYVLAIYPV